MRPGALSPTARQKSGFAPCPVARPVTDGPKNRACNKRPASNKAGKFQYSATAARLLKDLAGNRPSRSRLLIYLQVAFSSFPKSLIRRDLQPPAAWFRGTAIVMSGAFLLSFALPISAIAWDRSNTDRPPLFA